MAMPSVRASRGMLRSSMRPARLAAPIAPQMRTKIYGADKGDLNGPKGQEEIPQTPSGADAIKRNWMMPVAGASLLLLGAYAYMSGGAPKRSVSDLEIKDSAKSAAGEVKRKALEAEEKVKKSARDVVDRN